MSARTNDILASVVVFLVALPLCMGISIASGVPPALGLITGIIGGIIVGSVSGAPLQVSGPAAGLTVLVWEIIQKHGIEALGPVVLIAGALQVVAGRLYLGQWFRAMSPAVIYGMLAGIGVLILASQFHVMLDDKPKGSGIENLISIPAAIWGGIFPIDGSSHELAAVLGIVTITTLILWDKLKRGPLKLIPGALAGVLLSSGIAALLQLKVAYVEVPANLLDAVTLPGGASLALFSNPAILFSAAALSFIASAETLLSASAVDRMQTLHRTDYDKELTAQGLGNVLCGFVGALPMTGVIVRSSANVQAGARTRLSTILHGFYLLIAVIALPHVLRLIPTSALGAILVFTGYKLVNPESIRQLRQYGRLPVVIYVVTMVMIVCTDLLTGVLTGVALSVAKLLYHMTRLDVRTRTDGKRVYVELEGAATFVKLPKLASALEPLPAGAEVHLEIHALSFIDHACLDMLTAWRKQHEQRGGVVIVEWDGLRSRYARLATPTQQEPSLVTRAS
ncbi:MAG TPA: SulP family inorganic anion transporter [Bryobacteraceae bacterium]|nr:SulP family inorganic anion transporter [Bryobacteraceae bacterium]